MRKKEYLAVHQLLSTLMSNDDISCYTVHAMEEWVWWHFWQKKKSNFYLFLITIQLLCNYWLRRQGRYFRIVPKSCDNCVFPLLFSPPQGWSHMLKEQPALPAYNCSKVWSPRDSSCRYQPGLQRTFVAEIGAAQAWSTFLSSSQLSVLIDQVWESTLRVWPPSVPSPGQTSLNGQNGAAIHAPWPETSQPESFYLSAEFHQNPSLVWKQYKN